MTVAETGKSAAATSSGADATYHGITYSVTASNPAGCVSVDSATGAVSATAAGTATITATCKCGSTATTAVTVNKAIINTLNPTPSTITVYIPKNSTTSPTTALTDKITGLTGTTGTSATVNLEKSLITWTEDATNNPKYSSSVAGSYKYIGTIADTVNYTFASTATIAATVIVRDVPTITITTPATTTEQDSYYTVGQTGATLNVAATAKVFI
jgi:hypothetical protein